MFFVASSHGIRVAVHEFGGPADAPPLLLSHATGFHAHCYEPVAEVLSRHYRVFGLDYRGHGDTPAPSGWTVDWQRFGDDAVAVAESIAPHGGLVGVGHSMGGAALFMAAHRRPELFDHIVAFEPIAVPDDAPEVDMDSLPIVVGARRRRRVFPSFEDAIENYRTKLPLSVMTPEVLRAYVEHGFRRIDDGVELICSADVEVGIFTSSRDNGVWQLLPGIRTPATVVSGFVEAHQPSERCAGIAARLPHSRSIVLDHQSHLGPFSHPTEFADLVIESVGSCPAG